MKFLKIDIEAKSIAFGERKVSEASKFIP